VISIVAYFQNDDAYDSLIGVADLTDWEVVNGKDIDGVVQYQSIGVYNGQVTILRAAEFTLDVKINGVSITGAPFSTLTVTPTQIYAPQSVASSAPTTATAGVLTSFDIQERDFYGNNVQVLIATASSAKVQLLDATSQVLVVTGTLTDHATNIGVFTVEFASTISEDQSLVVMIEGQSVSGSPFAITVTPEATTDLTQTTITSFAFVYETGDY
jgi:hypothetical protein